MNRIIHVKITSDEPGRITEFYRQAFNWKVTKFPDPPDGWRMESGKGPGINSSVYRSDDSPMDRHLSIAISVDSIDEVAERISEAGGRIMHDRISAFGNCYLYCQDPDGNVICLVEFG
ncbi:MAG: VOC family protein [Candidatus Fermentibacteraceae bacterium]|nr:VOC family protein [Candidatus Fermentibacteraceae bacterium]MBN2607815.1 VOC family protein [Candidatus Fermentibacteraceae bacterium]